MCLSRCQAFVVATLVLSGCLGPGGDPGPGDTPDLCTFGGPPRSAPADRTAFNVTDQLLTAWPQLQVIFESPGHTVELDCERGKSLLDALAAAGADVRLRPDTYGDDVYLTRAGVTVHAMLRAVL